MENLFFKEKPVRIMVHIYRNQHQEVIASDLRGVCETTYSHTVKLLKKLEDEGYITRQKHGRKKIIMFTDKGEHIAEKLSEIVKKEMWS